MAEDLEKQNQPLSLAEIAGNDLERLSERTRQLAELSQNKLGQAGGSAAIRLHQLISKSSQARRTDKKHMANDHVWQASLSIGDNPAPVVIRSRRIDNVHTGNTRVVTSIFSGVPATILSTYPESEPVEEPARKITSEQERNPMPSNLSLNQMQTMAEDVLILEALATHFELSTGADPAHIGEQAVQGLEQEP